MIAADHTKTEKHKEAKVSGQRKTEASIDRFSALRNHRIRFDDAIDPNAERVNELDSLDILFGRGKGFQDHSGNKRMRQIVDKYKEQYHCLKRSQKRQLVEAVYREIVGGGARFLTKPTKTAADYFVLVDGEVALQKVNNALRCKKAYNKAMTGGMGKAGSVASTPVQAIASLGASTNGGTVESPARMPQDIGVFPSSSNVLGGAAAGTNQYDSLSPLGSMQLVPSMNGLQSGLTYYKNMLLRDQMMWESMMLHRMEHARNLDAPRVSSHIFPSHASFSRPLNGATSYAADGSGTQTNQSNGTNNGRPGVPR